MIDQTRRSKTFLLALIMMLIGTAGSTWALEAGDKAPDFKLPATTGTDIALSDFRGKKWVFLEFFAAAFVPT